MKRAVAAIASSLLAILFWAGLAWAPKPTIENCLTSYGGPGFSRGVNGKSISLCVSPEKFESSIFSTVFLCLDCHGGVSSLLYQAHA